MIIETSCLSKNYGSTPAVRDLTLRVPAGGVSAFLGPNGHGKTSTIKMLLGMTRPSAGHGTVFDLPISDAQSSVAIRQRTGFVSEDKQSYRYMTVSQMIRFTRGLYPTWRSDRERELLSAFELPLDRPVGKLSKGMRTKLALVLALSRGAELLILDEPSEGLDPMSSEIMLQQVLRAAADGATVFFSSHQLTEAERIADRVYLIFNGRLALEGCLDDLRASWRRLNAVFLHQPAVEHLRSENVASTTIEGNSCSVLASGESERIIAELYALGAVSVQERPVDLRELFLAHAQRTEQ
jgi:ABC-2 type transport system ATP-binding protein